ncbi:MAG: 2-dehydropantoate 2-reductase, partial [Planctomycetota bacterium]|nr:2-dehydropantoate 2-reductase [Planctomycetota bacterium]
GEKRFMAKTRKTRRNPTKTLRTPLKLDKIKQPPVLKVAVIGAGPIGSILGAYLARTKHHVTMVDVLKPRLETIRKIGITVSGVTNFQTPIHSVTNRISDLSPRRKINPAYIFLCTKASAIPLILKQVKSAITKDTVVISFQNGLDVENEIANILGKNRVLRVVINYAGNIINEGHIMMSFFNAPNYIGALTPASNDLAEKVASLLTQTGLTTKFVSNTRKYAWEKTILNSALSPVCALTKLKMSEAIEFPNIKKLVQELLSESLLVAKENGYDFGKKFINTAIEYFQKAGPHKPSMLIDIESKNNTEIDYLNGKIVEYGRAKNIPIPYNETLTSLIKGMEKSFLIAETTKKEKKEEEKA